MATSDDRLVYMLRKQNAIIGMLMQSRVECSCGKDYHDEDCHIVLTGLHYGKLYDDAHERIN